MNQINTQEKKVALVTGGARRIGAAIVRHLHQDGYKVAIHCNNSLLEAQALAAELNNQQAETAQVFAQDLRTPAASEQLINEVMCWSGRLDVLVNNASLFIRSKGPEFNAQDWHDLFTVNVQVPFMLSLAARPFLRQQRGVIINLTDIHATKPLKGYSVYCQSKAALAMQTKTLAYEWAPEIRVNAVAPGAIMWPEASNQLTTVQQQAIIKKTPLQCHGHPDYLAAAVVALIHNPFITGQELQVDGGRGSLS